MRISVFGLGYVGSVTAGCLAGTGHTVVGVEPNLTKVGMLSRGQSPIVEAGLEEILKKFFSRGQITATSDWTAAIAQTELAIVCVGTPSLESGNIDLSHVCRVAEHIGSALRSKKDYFRVVVRSTVLPGTMEEVVIPALERASGRQAGRDFGVCMNPEFLREGTAVQDFYQPPKTVIGELDTRSGEALAELYAKLPAPLKRVPLRVAEMVKYTDNSFHAVKVVFANEIGNICKELKIDSHRVMEIFCLDTKLNLSPSYLKPGFAFGGSCLPKDLRALLYKAKTLDVSLPILAAILPSNEQQIERAMRTVIEKGSKKVGILGFSFKAGTDDLRESPVVELTERLIGKGYDLRVYDANVTLAAIHGANRDYILNHIPHISRLMTRSIDEVLDHADTIVIGNAAPEFRDVPGRLTDGQIVVDFVRITDSRSVSGV